MTQVTPSRLSGIYDLVVCSTICHITWLIIGSNAEVRLAIAETYSIQYSGGVAVRRNVRMFDAALQGSCNSNQSVIH